MIDLERVSKRFRGVEAVRALDLHVPAGSICGFLGPNGAGKSTTLRMVAGALAADEGAITIDGLSVTTRRREAVARIGWLPEAAPAEAELRVEECLASRAALHGVPRRERRAAIDDVVSRCRLTEVRRRLAGQLSKGFRQRLGLAMALVHSPRVLILDEPTSGLDPAQVDEFRAVVGALAGRTTVLVSTHVLREVEALCDRVAVISAGRLVTAGPLSALGRASTGPTHRAWLRPADAASRALADAGVLLAAPDAAAPPGWAGWTFRCQDDAALAAAFARHGVEVRRLEPLATPLESAYREILSGGAAA